MRRLSYALLTLCGASTFFFGCRAPESIPVETIEEAPVAPLAPMVHAADPKAAFQLVKGFYEIEQNAWRWTAREFAVTLRPPARADDKGAVLRLKLTVPEPVIAKLRSVRLSARVGDSVLEPETYSKPGEYIYARDVPASALAGDAVTVEFALDKALPPGEVDQRELGVVVTSVGLELK